MLRTDGGYGVPGMPGNGGAYMAGNPSFDIGPRSPFKGMSREQLEELKRFDDRPQDLQQYYDRMNAPGPQLPFAGIPGSSNLPGAIGNMGGMQVAQGFNFLNPMSWFQGKPQEAIRQAEQGNAPEQGSGSLAEQMLRRRAEQERALQLLR